MNNYSKIKNESVINTDGYDRRRFQKIYGMSGGLQKLKDAENPFPTFEPLIGDIWSGLYKMSPSLKERTDIDDPLKANHSLMKRMLEDEHFSRYRECTKLDELSSAIGTVKFGEQTKEWLEDQRKQNAAMDSQIRDVQHMQHQLEKQEKDRGAEQVSKQLEQDLQKAMEGLDKQVQQQLNDNSHSFSQSMKQAVEETIDTKESMKSLFNGLQAGRGEAEMKKVPLRDQIQLADTIAQNKKVKEIAKWAGRFKRIARQKQKTRYMDASAKSGMTFGNEISQLLPAELALYNHKATKTDFIRRFVEKQTMQYETKGKETLGKGPIILCLDQSGSMHKLDTQAKGFALAFMSIARKQRRDFCLIPFSTKTLVNRYPKGKISANDMIQLCTSFLGGGTNFKLPLEASLRIINETSFKQSDIIFVTDGKDSSDRLFLKRFNEVKKQKEVSLLSLAITDQTKTLEMFSDKVVQIKDFVDRRGFQAFEV